MNMLKRLFWMIPVLTLALAGCSGSGEYPDGDSRYEAFAPDGIPFKVTGTPWTIDQRGNHRAVVTVSGEAPAVVTKLPWRRPDLKPETKRIIVTDASGNEIKDVIVNKLTGEYGEVVFRPSSGAGQYFIYYLPFKWQTWYNNVSDYLAPEYEADPSWVAQAGAAGEIPEAEVECFESVSRFHFWTPMGLAATADEVAAVKAAAGDMMVFPEDRAFPIQFRGILPVKWTKVPEASFKGLAMRNEYYTWQLGVWATGKELKNLKVSFSDLNNGGSVIGAGDLTCFNQEGTSWDGSHIEFALDVPKDRIQPLWCGVQIPEDARPGTYRGKVTVAAEGVDPQVIDLAIKVSPKVLGDKGDSEVWRHARLRWLNSTIALDDEPTEIYNEMTVNGREVEATGKTAILDGSGMVAEARTNGIDIFSAPQRLVVSTASGDIVFASGNLEIKKEASGLVTWTASSRQDGISFDLSGNMEYDGHMSYKINLSSEREMEVRDIRLETSYSAYSSEYLIGAGFDGRFRPASYSWDWSGPYDSYWIGGVKAGMHTEFRGGDYNGPLLWAFGTKPSPFWFNGGAGELTFSGAKGGPSKVVASTGRTVIGKEPKCLEFNLMFTPVKDLDPSKQFSMRFFHADPADFDKAAEDGANIANIHHAQRLNPYINYPFIVRDSLISFIRHNHENGRKVKLYYTIRELSAHCEEVYAFRSLGHEILETGAGDGNAWLCEHLVEDYWPAWYTSLDGFWKGDSDPALQMVGNSRYINYFLEGVRWMEENYDLDGLYMDDVSCDRVTIKRLRKILERYHDGALIDLHSNTWYSKGPANQYVEFFPYVDRLWFGESFQYDKMSPDEWLVTFSGIPFGVMSEMLQDGGNRFLGMVYGTTARHSWTDADGNKSPVPMWMFQQEYGLQDARMLGYWDPDCPVRSSDPEVKATVYQKYGLAIVSVGNFSSKDKTVRLEIDWKALGIDPAKATVTAPAIHNFQDETTFRPDAPLTVGGKRGWTLVIR